MGNDCSCYGEMGLGPWGYDTGNEWNFRGGKRITQIIIRCSGVIDSVMFKGKGEGDYSTQLGGNGGDKTVKINIDYPSEYLTGISGSYDSVPNHGNAVNSLTFHTNRNKYGPFGIYSGVPFSVISNDGVVTGFHGRSDRCIKSIGIYIMPLCSLSMEVPKEEHPELGLSSGVPPFLWPPRSAVAIGGCGGRDCDDGVFAAVKKIDVRIRHDTGVLAAIRFYYIKNDGSEFVSPFHGVDCFGGMHRKMISFSNEEDEYLIGVEGFYGQVEGVSDYNVIKSLSFITNKAKYGPVGAEMGTFFTSMNYGDLKRKVVGFHGRSGAYLDAIGTHTEYF